MSFCEQGLESKLSATSVKIAIDKKHPMIALANSLDWQALVDLVLPDLKQTTKGFWWLGRKLILRTHLGAYLIQQLFNYSDRQTERMIRDNAAYQLFCGLEIVNNWRCPDHTKIQEFRSRLSPETQCAIANEIAKLAAKLGFANPAHVDIDSTVQEPDMQFPATSHLLVKTAIIARRLQKLLMQKFSAEMKKSIAINIKQIKGVAKEYYYGLRKRAINYREQKSDALTKLWSHVSEQAMPIVQQAQTLISECIFDSLPKKQKKLIDHFTRKAPEILSGLYDRCHEAMPRRIKIYSYFRDAVHCFNKGKHHKPCEYGRQFQIGRIEGNFLYSIPNTSIHMPDARSLKPMVKKHIELFQKPIESISTDKGYYSKDNEKLALDFGIEKVGIQRPRRKLDKPPDNPATDDDQVMLANRRSGIEPLIGHLKRHWQMGRSRMKKDSTTESSGYCSMLGFNLRQLMRYLSGDMLPPVN